MIEGVTEIVYPLLQASYPDQWLYRIESYCALDIVMSDDQRCDRNSIPPPLSTIPQTSCFSTAAFIFLITSTCTHVYTILCPDVFAHSQIVTLNECRNHWRKEVVCAWLCTEDIPKGSRRFLWILHTKRDIPTCLVSERIEG